MPVSVVIPALNEAADLPETMRNLRELHAREIIFVDGGSTDGTRELVAAEPGVTLVIAPRGRAVQMNAGAARATGDVLLFLHADCHLDPGAVTAAEKALARRGVVAGCFSMRVRADGVL